MRCDWWLLLVACRAFLMFCSKLINKQGTISWTEIWQKAVSLDQLMSENENHTVTTHFLKEYLVCAT